jgi:putative Ca2+/H+ antiporter (TMEM165/GDT1 family)
MTTMILQLALVYVGVIVGCILVVFVATCIGRYVAVRIAAKIIAIVARDIVMGGRLRNVISSTIR